MYSIPFQNTIWICHWLLAKSKVLLHCNIFNYSERNGHSIVVECKKSSRRYDVKTQHPIWVLSNMHSFNYYNTSTTTRYRYLLTEIVYKSRIYYIVVFINIHNGFLVQTFGDLPSRYDFCFFASCDLKNHFTAAQGARIQPIFYGILSKAIQRKWSEESSTRYRMPERQRERWKI